MTSKQLILCRNSFWYSVDVPVKTATVKKLLLFIHSTRKDLVVLQFLINLPFLAMQGTSSADYDAILPRYKFSVQCAHNSWGWNFSALSPNLSMQGYLGLWLKMFILWIWGPCSMQQICIPFHIVILYPCCIWFFPQFQLILLIHTYSIFIKHRRSKILLLLFAHESDSCLMPYIYKKLAPLPTQLSKVDYSARD